MVWKLDFREGNVIPKFQIKNRIDESKNFKYILIEL